MLHAGSGSGEGASFSRSSLALPGCGTHCHHPKFTSMAHRLICSFLSRTAGCCDLSDWILPIPCWFGIAFLGPAAFPTLPLQGSHDSPLPTKPTPRWHYAESRLLRDALYSHAQSQDFSWPSLFFSVLLSIHPPSKLVQSPDLLVLPLPSHRSLSLPLSVYWKPSLGLRQFSSTILSNFFCFSLPLEDMKFRRFSLEKAPFSRCVLLWISKISCESQKLN